MVDPYARRPWRVGRAQAHGPALGVRALSSRHGRRAHAWGDQLTGRPGTLAPEWRFESSAPPVTDQRGQQLAPGASIPPPPTEVPPPPGVPRRSLIADARADYERQRAATDGARGVDGYTASVRGPGFELEVSGDGASVAAALRAAADRLDPPTPHYRDHLGQNLRGGA